MGSEKYKNPILYYENNLVFTKGKRDLVNLSGKECWAVYKWPGFNYDFLASKDKIVRLIKNSRGLQQAYSDVHILQIPLKNKINDSINYCKSIASGEMKAIALEYLNNVEEILSDSDTNENDNDTYIIFKLKTARTIKDYKDFLVSIAREPYRAVNELLNIDISEIYINEFDAYKRLEQGLKNIVKKYINIKEANEVDIERIIRSPFWRGLPPPKLRSKEPYFDTNIRKFVKAQPWKPSCTKSTINGREIYRPLKKDILTLCEGQVYNHMKYIEIKHFDKGTEKTSYQQFVVISGLPDIEFPTGREWIYKLKDLPFPTWTSIRFSKRSYEEVAKDINARRKELDDYFSHVEEAPGEVKVGEQYHEQDRDIDQAKYEVEKQKKPFLYTTIIIAVASDSKEECFERAKMVQDYFDEIDIETQIPTGDQWKLFNETLLGNKQYALDYVHRIPPETLAGSMIGASNIIGDLLGLYLGATGILGKLVRFDPFRASQIDESPAISFTGTLGKGKSLLANLIALLCALLGGKVLIVDPKSERGNWAKVLTWLKPYLNIIELSPAKESKGKLDMFRVMIKSLGNNPTEDEIREASKIAAEYALTILGTLCGYKTNDEKMEYLADAVNLVSQDLKPNMAKVITSLEHLGTNAQSSNDREMYSKVKRTILNRINNSAYSHLLFGDGTEEVIDITKPINIIQTQNLTIPEEGKAEEDYTYQERVGMALLLCTSAIGMEFARQGRDMLKVFIQDEASVLKRSSTGKALKNRMVKMGRTEFASIFLIGQNVSDIGEDEDVKANIGTKFAFATNSKAEAREVLKYLELNYESEELQEMLIELPTGVCLMKDIEGRVAVLEVEPLFDDLIEAFNTTPELRVDRDDTSDKTAKKTESSTVEDESINEEAIEESVSDENVEYLEVDVEAIENEGIEQGEQVVEEKAEQTGKDINNFLNEWGK